MSRLPSALIARLPPEPGDDPDDIHGRGIHELLQVRPRQPNVPTAAEIKTPYPLGQRTLYPRPERILRFELWRLLALPRGLERLMVDLWADRELAGGCLGGRALPTDGTRTTGRPVKPDANDRAQFRNGSWYPCR